MRSQGDIVNLVILIAISILILVMALVVTGNISLMSSDAWGGVGKGDLSFDLFG